MEYPLSRLNIQWFYITSLVCQAQIIYFTAQFELHVLVWLLKSQPIGSNPSLICCAVLSQRKWKQMFQRRTAGPRWNYMAPFVLCEYSAIPTGSYLTLEVKINANYRTNFGRVFKLYSSRWILTPLPLRVPPEKHLHSIFYYFMNTNIKTGSKDKVNSVYLKLKCSVRTSVINSNL